MYSGFKDYSYVCTNKGVGPAFITNIEVKDSEGKTYDDLVPYVSDKLSPIDSTQYCCSDIMNGFW